MTLGEKLAAGYLGSNSVAFSVDFWSGHFVEDLPESLTDSLSIYTTLGSKLAAGY